MGIKTDKSGRTVILRKGDRITVAGVTLTVARVANVNVYFEEKDQQGQHVIATRAGLNERLLTGQATLSYDKEKAYRRGVKPIF